MPFTFEIDRAANLIRVNARSELHAEKDKASLERILGDPDFQPGMNLIVDRRCEGSVSNSDYIWTIAEAFKQTGAKALFGRVAIVVSQTATIGLLNMFLTLAEEDSGRFRVFQDYDEAERWLSEKPS